MGQALSNLQLGLIHEFYNSEDETSAGDKDNEETKQKLNPEEDGPQDIVNNIGAKDLGQHYFEQAQDKFKQVGDEEALKLKECLR